MVVCLNYSSQNGGNVYRALYYNRNPNIGPRIIGNLDQYPDGLNPKAMDCGQAEQSFDCQLFWDGGKHGMDCGCNVGIHVYTVCA